MRERNTASNMVHATKTNHSMSLDRQIWDAADASERHSLPSEGVSTDTWNGEEVTRIGGTGKVLFTSGVNAFSPCALHGWGNM
jgi:hypothetical protein